MADLYIHLGWQGVVLVLIGVFYRLMSQEPDESKLKEDLDGLKSHVSRISLKVGMGAYEHRKD